jgi:membrane fusion protein (multidrug efflux system)
MLALLLTGAFLGSACSPDAGGNPRAERQRAGEERQEEEPPRSDAIVVRAAKARRGAISELYETSATLRAERRATVTARTRGRIESLLVEEGDRVERGEPMLRLEDEEQSIAAQRARTTYETKKKEFERLARLFEQELVSANEFEAARRERDDARHALELAELELSRTVIHAPFDGTVLERHVDVGATVSDGTAVYDVADLTPLEADVRVPEQQVVTMSVGQSVQLVSGASGAAYDARVERIAPAVDPETGTVKVTVAVNRGGDLRPGAFVRVAIVSDTKADALILPRRALVAEGSRFSVFRLRGESGALKAEELRVEPGVEQGDEVEIRAVLAGTELEPGDRVVVAGAPALSDGMPVRLADESADDSGDESGDESADEAAGEQKEAPATAEPSP